MDFTTPTQVAGLLGDQLSPAEVLALPRLISTATQVIQRHCNRRILFTAGIDQLFTVDRHQQIILGDYPVWAVHRVSAGPAVALKVRNANPAVGRARVQLDAATIGGGIAASLTLQGRTLGRPATLAIDLATIDPPTLGELARRINLESGGWRAEAVAEYADWGVDELVAGQGSQAAHGEFAEFITHAVELDYQLDQEAGLVTLIDDRGDESTDWRRFGPSVDLAGDGLALAGGYQGVRINYDAGLKTVPLDLELACVELIKFTLERMATSSVLQSEKTDVWSWTAREYGEVIGGMPAAVREIIASYRNLNA